MWLASIAPASRDGYADAAADWLTWCRTRHLDPLDDVRAVHINRYADHLADQPCGRCHAGTYTAASRAKRISAVCSLYDRLAGDGVLTVSPTGGVRRPRVDTTIARGRQLTEQELAAIVAAAHTTPDPAGRTAAVTETLACLGLRVSELVSLQTRAYTIADGRRALWFTGKGTKDHLRAVPDHLADVLDRYLEVRAAHARRAVGDLGGPMFVTATGQPLTRQQVYDMVRRLARRAGIAGRVGPHSFRATFVAHARAAGVELYRIQESLGHANMETTRRYDRARSRVDDDVSVMLAQLRSRGTR